MKEQEKDKSRKLTVTFRVFQAIFFGMFALGVSMILGDLTKAIELPISNFSMTTTAFGLIGARFGEMCARHTAISMLI